MTQLVLKLDLKDLEKLLVSDGKVNLEIGNAIVQEFSKRYLKGIAQSFSENWIRSVTYESANRALTAYLNDNKIYANLMHERTEKLVKEKVLSGLIDELRKEAQKFLDESELNSWIREYVAAYVRNIIYKVLQGMRDQTFNSVLSHFEKAYCAVKENEKEKID